MTTTTLTSFAMKPTRSFWARCGRTVLLLVAIASLGPMQKASAQVRVLAYGDSNTFGIKPVSPDGPLEHYPEAIRWPGVMQAELGPGYIVEVNGKPGRTFGADLKDKSGSSAGKKLNGMRQLPVALESAKPVNILIVMLGSNDLMDDLHLKPAQIAQNLARLAKLVPPVPDGSCSGTQLLVVIPPRLSDTSRSVFSDSFSKQAVDNSGELAAAYDKVGARYNMKIFNAGAIIAADGIDGVHMSSEQHSILGKAVAKEIISLHSSCQEAMHAP